MNRWSNGSYSISWLNADQIIITDCHLNRSAVMDGGDFEYALMALIAAFNSGVSNSGDSTANDKDVSGE